MNAISQLSSRRGVQLRKKRIRSEMIDFSFRFSLSPLIVSVHTLRGTKSWFAHKKAARSQQLVSAAAAFFPFRLNKHERGRDTAADNGACSFSLSVCVCANVCNFPPSHSPCRVCVLLGDEIPAAEAKSSAAASSNASSLQSAASNAAPPAADSDAPSASVSLLLFVKIPPWQSENWAFLCRPRTKWLQQLLQQKLTARRHSTRTRWKANFLWSFFIFPFCPCFYRFANGIFRLQFFAGAYSCDIPDSFYEILCAPAVSAA